MRSPFGGRWRRTPFTLPDAVDAALSVSDDGSTITFTDLGGDAFSVTVSGSSTSAYNGTYTQDVDGTALTGAALTSAGTMCLVKPAIEIGTDVDSDTLADAGDTLAMTYRGLWIYDADSAYPGDPTYQWDRDGSAISGATDETGYLLVSADQETTITLDETFGGNTVTTTGITVEAGSAMEGDASALYWFSPSNVTTSGGTLTAWPDNSGNGRDLGQGGAITQPAWNAGGYAVFTGSELMASAINASAVSQTIDAGNSAIIFVVAELDASGQGGSGQIYTMWREDSNTTDNTVMRMALNHLTSTPDTTVIFHNSHFGLGAGNSTGYDDNTSRSGVKAIYEFEVTQADWAIRQNGVDLVTGASTPGSFFATAAAYIMLGGRSDLSTMDQGWVGNIHEVFATSDVSGANVSAIRTELATNHGITL